MVTPLVQDGARSSNAESVIVGSPLSVLLGSGLAACDLSNAGFLSHMKDVGRAGAAARDHTSWSAQESSDFCLWSWNSDSHS